MQDMDKAKENMFTGEILEHHSSQIQGNNLKTMNKRISRKRTINWELNVKNFDNITVQFYLKFSIATMEVKLIGY